MMGCLMLDVVDDVCIKKGWTRVHGGLCQMCYGSVCVSVSV